MNLGTRTRKLSLTLCIVGILTVAVQAQSSGDALHDNNTAYAPDVAPLPDAPSASIKHSTPVSVNTESAAPVSDLPQNLSIAWAPGVELEKDHGFKPLSVGEKFRLFLESSYSSSTLAAMAFTAQTPGILRSADQEQHWNVGQRYAAAYVDTQSSAFFEDFLIPALTHQDPLYHREALGSTRDRVRYAMTRVFIARNDKGGSSFNTSSVAGAFVSSALHNTYHPYNNTSADGTMNRALGRLATRAGMNIVREFWPDVRRRFKGRVGAMMEAYKP